MEKSVSRTLVETAVKTTLKSMKNDPERGVRNLVDIALQCSEGRFQRHFFSTAQTMLQNENSAYYRLIRDLIAHTDINRLYTVGINLGYNAYIVGAQHIRENEKKLQCNIPWTIAIQIDDRHFSDQLPQYQNIIETGNNLGIFSWILFTNNDPYPVLSLADNYPDNVFFLFCEASKLSTAFLDSIAHLYNIMLVIRYDESISPLCKILQNRGLLYSVWYLYEQKDTEAILNGDLFYCTQELSPVFTALLPSPNCPDIIQQLVHQAVEQARSRQAYHTIPWDMPGDNQMIDSIISGDPCSACFDENGYLCNWNGQIEEKSCNLFHDTITHIFKNAFPKNPM